MSHRQEINALLQERAVIKTGSVTHRKWKARLRQLMADLDRESVLVQLGIRSDTASANGGSTPDNDSDPVQWTAIDSGLSTATGPNGQTASVTRLSGTAHAWSVEDKDHRVVDSGVHPDHQGAKAMAEGVMTGTHRPLTSKGSRGWTRLVGYAPIGTGRR